MEDQTQKILSLQEEIINLQKLSYQNNLQTTKKTDDNKTTVLSLLIISLLSLTYALVMSFLYFS